MLKHYRLNWHLVQAVHGWPCHHVPKSRNPVRRILLNAIVCASDCLIFVYWYKYENQQLSKVNRSHHIRFEQFYIYIFSVFVISCLMYEHILFIDIYKYPLKNKQTDCSIVLFYTHKDIFKYTKICLTGKLGTDYKVREKQDVELDMRNIQQQLLQEWVGGRGEGEVIRIICTIIKNLINILFIGWSIHNVNNFYTYRNTISRFYVEHQVLDKCNFIKIENNLDT